VGGLIGGWFATTVGSEQILGFAGWRFPLYLVAVVGVMVGLLVFSCTVDPGAAHQIKLDPSHAKRRVSSGEENLHEQDSEDGEEHPKADDWSCDVFYAVPTEHAPSVLDAIEVHVLRV